jgi:uncharacterized protein (TIRG00374 family)
LSRAIREPRSVSVGGRRSFLEGRGLRLALLAAGLVLVAVVFGSVGWREIGENVARAGPWFPALVVLYAAAQIAFALGWWVVLDPVEPRPRFFHFFLIYLAGDAANIIAPGNVAGEPLKVHLLGESTGKGSALASVTIHKHADMLAQWIFIVAGVTVALVRFPLPVAARAAAIATTAGLGVALLLLSWALPRGTYSPLLRTLSRWRFLARRLERFRQPAERVDGRISEFYAVGRRRFVLSAASCFAGWCGGLLETWLILRLLVPGAAGWAAAFAIEALAMTINNLFVFVPGRVGTSEGVRVAVFVLLGLPAASGAAYALLRRGRELAWTVPGLTWIARHARSAGVPAAETPLARLAQQERGS